MHAQYAPHFTNWIENPIPFNPAFTGAISGDLANRAGLIYRNQWKIALQQDNFKYWNAYFDKKHVLTRGTSLGWGLNLSQKHTGSYGDKNAVLFDEYDMSASLALHQLLGKGSRKGGRNNTFTFLSFGMETGMYMYRFDADRLTFDDQYMGTGQNLGASSEEIAAMGMNNQIIPDFSAGVNFSHVFNQESPLDDYIRLGFSLNHFLPSRFSLTGNESSQLSKQRQLLFNIDGNSALFSLPYSISYNLLYSKSGIVSDQGKQWYFIGSSILWLKPFSKSNNGNDSWGLGLGGGIRLGGNINNNIGTDALFVTVKIKNQEMRKRNISAGTSLDFNISKWSQSSKSFGGVEIFANYSFGYDNKSFYCPSF